MNYQADAWADIISPTNRLRQSLQKHDSKPRQSCHETNEGQNYLNHQHRAHSCLCDCSSVGHSFCVRNWSISFIKVRLTYFLDSMHTHLSRIT